MINPDFLYGLTQGDIRYDEETYPNVFTVGFNVKGRYGFPNVFIEKEFGVPATTRNWNTILRILK